LKLLRDGDRLVHLLIFNEEFLVSACHQRALITSLPFVHTARRSYRLNDPVRPLDWGNEVGSPNEMPREVVQTLSFRGRRSRNKVSVGEPAEGSLTVSFLSAPLWASSFCVGGGGASVRARRAVVRGEVAGARGSPPLEGVARGRDRVGTTDGRGVVRVRVVWGGLVSRDGRARVAAWPSDSASDRRVRVVSLAPITCVRCGAHSSAYPRMARACRAHARGAVPRWRRSPRARDLLASCTSQNTTTPADGYLGSRNDEERSEMRYVM
jgi:hypothetical protein